MRRAIGLVDEFRRDLRDAARALTKPRVFGAAAVLMLALGIGANSAMFALVDAILLRPLPFPDPDRLVMLWERTEASSRGRVSPLNLHDWTEAGDPAGIGPAGGALHQRDRRGRQTGERPSR
jgi:putative ABC transport system permease protein